MRCHIWAYIYIYIYIYIRHRASGTEGVWCFTTGLSCWNTPAGTTEMSLKVTSLTGGVYPVFWNWDCLSHCLLYFMRNVTKHRGGETLTRPELCSVRPEPCSVRPEPSSVRPQPSSERPEPCSVRPERSSVCDHGFVLCAFELCDETP